MKGLKKVLVSLLSLSLAVAAIVHADAKTFTSDEYATLSNGLEVKLIAQLNGEDGDAVMGDDGAHTVNEATQALAFDGDTSTKVVFRKQLSGWGGVLQVGDYVGVEFKQPTTFRGINFNFGSHDADSFGNATLQYKLADSEEWVDLTTYESEKVNSVDYLVDEEIENVAAVRLVNGTYKSNNWLFLYEVTVDGEYTPEEIPGDWITLANGLEVEFMYLYNAGAEGIIAADGNKPCAVAENVNAVFDGDTSTYVILRDDTDSWNGYVAEGDYVGVRFKYATNLTKASFVFDAANAGDTYDNGKIQYLVGEEWVDAKEFAGTGVTEATFEDENGVNNVTAVRYICGTLSGNSRRWVRLHEITVEGTKAVTGKANYLEVTKAVKAAEALVKEDYASFDAVEDALNAVVYDLDASQQETVDGYAQAINDAIAALVQVRFALTKEEITITEVGNEQAQEPLSNVFDGDVTTLWHTDWSGSDRETHYFELAVPSAIYEKAMLLARPQNGADGDQNGVITKLDVYAKSGEGEWVKVADGVELTADGWQTVEFDTYMQADALKFVVVDSDSSNDKVFSSLAELKIYYVASADYTAYDAHKEYAESIKDSTTYTEESLNAYLTKVNEVNLELPYTKQADLDALVAELDALKEALTVKSVDYSALDAVIAEAEGLTATDYEDFSAVETALAAAKAVDRNLGLEDQATIDEAAAALRNAIDALVSIKTRTEIPTSEMTATAGDSQSGEGADMAIDNNANTMWHTNWNGSERDLHYFIVTLDEITNIDGLKVLNRQNNQNNGSISKFDLYVRVSEDAEWELVLEDAVLDPTSKEWQTVDFDAVDALQVKLVVKDSAEDPNQPGVLFSSMAEFRLYDTGAEVEQLADYTEVKAAVKAAEALNADAYVDFSAVEAAVEAVVYGLRESAQAEVDAYAKAIEDAIAALVVKDGDYTKVEEAKAKVPADLTIYTEESVAKLEAALDAVEEGLKADKQAEIDAYAKAIEDAIKGLKVIEADYTAVDEAIANVPADKDNYVDFSAVDAAVAAVVRGLAKAEQATVDGYAKAINDAVAALELKDADYTEIEELVEIISGLDKDLYKNFEIVEEASKEIVYGLDITKQAEVDAYAKAVKEAIAALELKEADYTTVDSLILIAGSLDKDLFENYDAVEDAIAAVVRGLDITKQDEVEAMAGAIANALESLKVKEEEKEEEKPTPEVDDDDDETPTPEEDDETPTPEEETENDNVNTSDSTSLFTFIAMMAMAVAAFFVSRKSKED